MRGCADLDERDLLRCLPMCLSGMAAHWYETSSEFRTWDQFVRAWRENYVGPDYQERLERELLTRRQGRDEPVRDYVTLMRVMMKRLATPWSESKRIDTVYWGAREELRAVVSLRLAASLEDLERELREAEILTADEQGRLREFLETELTDFAALPGLTDLTKHRIDVGENRPIKQRYYPVSPKVQEAIYREVDKLLAEDIIEPSNSEWSSPIVMVKKSNGKYRFCLDFRKVNEVSKKDAYPLPIMSSILDKLRAARYISTLDLSQAYFQIPLEESSKPITAFTVPGKGLFQFKRMPYGLSGAPATFQRLLDRLIGPEMEPHAFAYLDDIIIATSTFEEHLSWLSRIFRRIKSAGLIVNPEKCEFCREEVRYLGFVVSREGLKVDSEKVAPVLSFPVPRNIRQLRRFLGMASWYRRFIPDFATVAEPLNILLRKGQPWKWEDGQQSAFEKIRHLIATAPTLACPHFDVPFVLQTDASTVGLGAVLVQEIEGVERVIAFASRALTEPERKYSATELECLAIVWAVQKFRPYLEGYHFTVVTDHHSLRWLRTLKNPSGRLARWALQLLEYDFAIAYRQGALNHVPDALSRMFENTEEGSSEGGIPVVAAIETNWYDAKFSAVTENPKGHPGWEIRGGQLYRRRADPWVQEVLGDDLDEWKLVVPEDRIPEILREAHDEEQAGHLGVEKTYRRIITRYFWPGIFRTVTEYVRRCPTCQLTKVEQKPPSGLMGRRRVEVPWVVIAADIMGPFPPSRAGFQYLLVIQDLFTKWIECCPLRRATGPKISEALDDLIFSRWGTPEVILTDNGTEFVNRAIQDLASSRGIATTTTPPYHPQANPVERVNRVLKTMIVSYIGKDHRNWDQNLSSFRFAYNTAYHSALQSSPAFLNFGREPRPRTCRRAEGEGIPELETADTENWGNRVTRLTTLRAWVAENLEQAYQSQAKHYNLRRRDTQFKIGDLVLRKQRILSSAAQNVAAKLCPKYCGPFCVGTKLSTVVYGLRTMEGKEAGKAHVSDLKRYTPPPPKNVTPSTSALQPPTDAAYFRVVEDFFTCLPDDFQWPPTESSDDEDVPVEDLLGLGLPEKRKLPIPLQPRNRLVPGKSESRATVNIETIPTPSESADPAKETATPETPSEETPPTEAPATVIPAPKDRATQSPETKARPESIPEEREARTEKTAAAESPIKKAATGEIPAKKYSAEKAPAKVAPAKSGNGSRPQATTRNTPKEGPRRATERWVEYWRRQAGESKPEVPRPDQCWNCGEIGHRRKDCRHPPRQHCYRCGRAGCSVNTCPVCGPDWCQEILDHPERFVLDKSELYLTSDFFTDIEDEYLSHGAAIDEWITSMTPSIAGNAPSPGQPPTPQEPGASLPPINLPTFARDLLQWESFKDQFTSLVHRSAKLFKVRKLQYLKSCLTGEAAKMLALTPVTDGNYDEAWASLEMRFGNRRVLSAAHMRRLMNAPPATKFQSSEVKRLLDEFRQTQEAFKALGKPVEEWDEWFLFLLVKKLDYTTRLACSWRTEFVHAISSVRPTETISTPKLAVPGRLGGTPVSRTTMAVKVEESRKAKGRQCPLCSGGHALGACKKYKGHNLQSCTSNFRCWVCGDLHHTTLHDACPKGPEGKRSLLPIPTCSSYAVSSRGVTLLATARVLLEGPDGRTLTVRALLDSGSEYSFLSEWSAQTLRLRRRPVRVELTGYQEIKVGTARSEVSVELRSPVNTKFRTSMEALVTKSLTAHTPSHPLEKSDWGHIKGLTLADPSYNVPGGVDVLLGADVCGRLFQDRRAGPPGTPTAVLTPFGWTLLGSTRHSEPRKTSRVLHIRRRELPDLQRYWELEEVLVSTPLTPDELKCERLFQDTTNYVEFMEGYHRLGHMLEAPGTLDDEDNGCYVPHHAVWKTTEGRQKIRVVFNASNVTSGGSSLNEALLPGPKLQADLWVVVTRWRLFKLAFSTDIVKMFRQILIHPDDQDWLHILWRKHPGEKVTEY
ncbi:uncharacterized protein LOC143361015 [Halictus rubicundus]|uniref:uncharacterized protein LOC143361015 n=1 Tax=Halictus rubicundus TaxID=77578 RepID=UPI004035829B